MLSWTPLFYALVLLRQLMFEYVRSLASVDTDDTQLAVRLAIELLGFCAGDELTHVARVPVAGVDISEAHVTVADCTLKKLTAEDLGQMSAERNAALSITRVSRTVPVPAVSWISHLERIVLEVTVTRSKIKVYDPSERCQRILLALHLVASSTPARDLERCFNYRCGSSPAELPTRF